MGKMLEALARLQSIEHQVADVRRRLRTRSAAVKAQEAQIAQLKESLAAQHEAVVAAQKRYGAVELELRTREEHVAKLRASLNTARTNKEYATVLTEINTFKADNSKLEDDGLKIMQAVDAAKTEAEKIKAQIEQAEKRRDEIARTSAEEIARLEALQAELAKKRKEATAEVPPKELRVFEKIAATRDGDAMAEVEMFGRKPPYEYVCGGCHMGLRAEHANALRTRDEIRTCESCGRILFLKETSTQTA